MTQFGSSRHALAQYTNSRVEPGGSNHTPHELIQMLFDGCMKNINIASACLSHGNIEGKGIHVSKAIDIINLLRSSLDHQVESPLPSMLTQMYDYLEFRLFEANATNDKRMFVESMELLKMLKSAWDEIGDSAKATGT